MVTERDISDVLRSIDDPEMPISIVDLGIVEHIRIVPGDRSSRVEVDILPTFVGCPALPVLEEEIKAKVNRMAGVEQTDVAFVFDPPWSVDRISDAGRQSLKELGITVPGRTPAGPLVQVNVPVVCPFCHATNTELTSAFGPTRCRMIYYCEACKNSFEHMKRL